MILDQNKGEGAAFTCFVCSLIKQTCENSVMCRWPSLMFNVCLPSFPCFSEPENSSGISAWAVLCSASRCHGSCFCTPDKKKRKKDLAFVWVSVLTEMLQLFLICCHISVAFKTLWRTLFLRFSFLVRPKVFWLSASFQFSQATLTLAPVWNCVMYVIVWISTEVESYWFLFVMRI